MKIVRKIFTIVLALAVFAGTILLENSVAEGVREVMKSVIAVVPSPGGVQLVRGGQSGLIKEQTDLEPGDALDIPTGQTAVILFSDNGLVRVAPESRLVFIGQDAEHDGFIFELKKGRAWLNSNFTSSSVNVLAGGALLVPRKAAVDISFDGSKTLVRAYIHQVGVGLVTAAYKPSNVIRFSDGAFVNSFLVAQGSQATIFLDKIQTDAETLGKLLYSKLIKEFQYGLYDKVQMQKDGWFTQNIAADNEFAQQVARNKLKSINARGLKIASLDSIGYQLQKATDRFANALTFTEDRIIDRTENALFDQLFDAEYLLVFGRSTEAKERLNLFRQLVSEETGKQSEEFKALLMARLRDSYSDLMFVLPDDPLFDVKTTVSDVLFLQLGNTDDDITEKFTIVRDSMNYAYRLADSNVVLARVTLDQYYRRFQDLVKAEKNKLVRVKYLMAEENQVMDNLFRQFPQFYQDGFFAMKRTLENEWLSLLPEGNDKTEERQTIISTKIDFLRQLQEFFLDEKVSLKDARLVAFRLINEIKDLQTGAEVGVSQLFAIRLKDYGQFLRFLNTTELGTLRGVSIRDTYAQFLAAQKEQVSIEQAIKEFLGEQPVAPVVTAEQILEQAKKDFADAGITDLKLGTFTSLEQRYIYVQSGSHENIVFQAQYDWDRKLLSDIRVGTTVVSKEPIRLENLALVLKPAVPVPAPQPPAPAPTQETQEVSKAERVAKILLLQKLKAGDVTTTEANIEVRDLTNGLFVVQGANLISNKQIQLAFGFRNKENIAFAIVVRTVLGDQKLEAEVNIADLAARVKEIYDNAQQEAKKT